MPTKIIESCYFHTGNGGLQLRVVEHEYVSEAKTLPGGVSLPETTYTHYTFQASYSHHGAEMQMEFDLGSLEIVGWVHQATGRLLKRMLTKHDAARNSGFDYRKLGNVSAEDGGG